MVPLVLHDFHLAHGASFSSQNGHEAAASYGSTEAEYRTLTEEAGLIDLSFRSRICLLGADREKFLHGQVSNEVLRLKIGEGTYATLVTAKGKVESDLFIYKLKDELLLDFEPGLTQKVSDRLARYVIAEDVQIVDVAPHYSLLSVQGPRAAEFLSSTTQFELPTKPLAWSKSTAANGEIYIVQNGRFGLAGFDLFVPAADTLPLAEKLTSAIKLVGLEACETARIENAVPRFGIDIDESNLAPEAVGENAISYAKGCYIGQEVIARIRTYGQVAKSLRLLRLPEMHRQLPMKGEKLFNEGKEVGYITSATKSPKLGGNIALAYVRREANAAGSVVQLGSSQGPDCTVISASKP